VTSNLGSLETKKGKGVGLSQVRISKTLSLSSKSLLVNGDGSLWARTALKGERKAVTVSDLT